jgi:hypothetical protein
MEHCIFRKNMDNFCENFRDKRKYLNDFQDDDVDMTFANSLEFSPLSTKFRALFAYSQKWNQAFSFQPYLYLVPTYPFLLPAPHAL